MFFYSNGLLGKAAQKIYVKTKKLPGRKLTFFILHQSFYQALVQAFLPTPSSSILIQIKTPADVGERTNTNQHLTGKMSLHFSKQEKYQYSTVVKWHNTNALQYVNEVEFLLILNSKRNIFQIYHKKIHPFLIFPDSIT